MATKPENKLRTFKDTDDLFDNVDSETILKWINQLAKQMEYRKGHQKVYQAQKRLLVKYAKEQMDPDELKRIGEIAAEEAANGEESSSVAEE